MQVTTSVNTQIMLKFISMEKLLYEKYKLIELNETQINGAWKGAHLLLFFLAFVFGSFCTFCFHMLIYFFEEKCVLYPKLLSLSTVQQSAIKEILPYDSGELDGLPVDFVTTQWVDQSVCLLPTYVPLVSGISGLIWTTLFLMCSTGSRVFTGLEQSWRILPPALVFSLAMGGTCLYTTVETARGIRALCSELADITGDQTCSFTVNVATLAYERRICGVYQAVELTLLTAWLHTLCWLLSALLIAARVLLAVDFQLVRISVYLQGNIEQLLRKQEHQMGAVSYGANRRRDRCSPDYFILRSVEPGEHVTSYMRTVPRDQKFIVRTVINLVNNVVTLAEFIRKNQIEINETKRLTAANLNAEPNLDLTEDKKILRSIKTHDGDEIETSVYFPIKNKDTHKSQVSFSEESVSLSESDISYKEEQSKETKDKAGRESPT